MRTLHLALICLPILILTHAGCSDTTEPTETAEEGAAIFDGGIDPANETFVLKRLEQPFPGREPVRIELLGSNLQVGEGTVSLDVAVRNADHRRLFAPGVVWVSDFTPPTITVTNADVIRDSTVSPDSVTADPAYGFDYTTLLGGDEVLDPGETSGAKTWVFGNRDLVSFSFAARARFALMAEYPRISGILFEDRNRNGVRDPDEGPFLAGVIHLRRPNGQTETAWPGQNGRYGFPAREPGLYELTFESLVDCLICVTTPNPLQVVLPPGPGSIPMSFPHADFGAVCGPCWDPVRPVVMTYRPPVPVTKRAPYGLVEARQEGDLLILHVGYGGCQREHPITLYAGRPFAESNPVQTWMLLVHDDLGELCRGWFERTLVFDLGPIRAAHIEDYGAPGPVMLVFRDYDGQEQVFWLYLQSKDKNEG
jgi:hypothetical protein